jgi:TP901 family phage tail tape measure protein
VNLDDGATWSDVEETIRGVSRELGIAFEKTAELTAMAGQGGIAYKDLAEFVRLAAKTSSAWDIAPKEAAQQMAQVKAMTQWSNKQLEEYADKVNALGDASASAEKDIAEMFKRAAGSAKAAGVDFDTSLGITTALNSIGMAEEVAARFFNAFSSKLRTASDGSSKAAEGYKMLGLSAQQVEKGMKKDAAKTIIDVLDRLENHKDKAKVAVKLFGQEWWDEAARAGQALPEIRKNLELLLSGKWKGSLATNLATDLSTTAKTLERTKAIVAEIGDRIGRWALPPLNASLQALIDKYDAWVKQDKDRADAKAIAKKLRWAAS